jgi:acyl carrier protein
MSDDISGRINRFIATRYPTITIGDDEDIFSLGFVNSLFAMELVMFLEKTFDLAIPNDELKIDNFRTVRSMTSLVDRQLVTGAARSR